LGFLVRQKTMSENRDMGHPICGSDNEGKATAKEEAGPSLGSG
jgi:hypothetical protein